MPVCCDLDRLAVYAYLLVITALLLMLYDELEELVKRALV